MQVPAIGRVVTYRSRTGRYDVPAIITATTETLDPQGVALYHETQGAKGVPPLDSPEHVHLTVLTPGIPGFRAEGLAGEGDSPLEVRDQSGRAAPMGYGENAGGSYQEWNVPLNGGESSPVAVVGTPNAGTWRWPVIRTPEPPMGAPDPGLAQARQTQPEGR